MVKLSNKIKSIIKKNRLVRHLASTMILNYYDIRGNIELIEIDPSKVSLKMPRWRELYWQCRPGEVVGGVWDIGAIPIEESELYIGFKEHFCEDLPWEDTAYYRRISWELDRGSQWHGATTKNEIVQQLTKYDQLYNKIEDEGYKSQRELESEGYRQRLKPPDLCEALVNIDRQGKLVLDDGRHRLAIARLLDVETIPACIIGRHKKAKKQIYHDTDIQSVNGV